MKKKTPPQFAELIDNAFDFLQTAIREFDKKPKYSVIHFAIAIELLLKSRLLQEHWSLIIDGPPDFKKFKEGNFRSINFKELIPRLEQALEEPISNEIKRCFDAIANHRNKMIHFFHEGAVADNKKVIDEIAREQSRGWIYLQRLFEKWQPIFADYENKITGLDKEMKGHRIHLKEIFDSLKSEIQKDKKLGAEYRQCSGCQQKASRKEVFSPLLSHAHCIVCLLDENLIYPTCPKCDKKVEISNYDYITGAFCPKCSEEIPEDDLKDQLDTNPTTTDNYFDQSIMNCAECMEHDSVIQHDDHYICLNCLYVEKGIQYCEWCSEGQIGGGDLTHSGLSGCEFCDGRLGYEKD